MGIIFPVSPSTGQTFTDAAGATWVWNGKQWTSALSSNIFLPVTGGTMTGLIGNLKTNDPPAGDSSQLVPNTEWIANNRPQNRNRLINGSFLVDQRNNFAAITLMPGFYVCDRWTSNVTQPNFLTAAINYNNGPGQPLLPCASYITFRNSGGSYTPLATDYFFIYQPIEFNNMGDFAFGTSAAQPLMLSFWVAAGIGGTYSGTITDGMTNRRCYPFTFTVPTNVWVKVAVPIPPDTAGNWAVEYAIDAGMCLFIDLGAGSNYRAPAGAWVSSGQRFGANGAMQFVTQPTNSYISFGNIQLEVGTQATPFDWRSYGEELALCQRYYQYAQFSLLANGGGSYGGDIYSNNIRPNMRVAPTSTFVNVIYGGGQAGFPNIGTATDAYYATNVGVQPLGAYINGGLLLDAEL